jgi:hypothetical protein
MKEQMLKIIGELEDEVHAMREEGETDLRTVLRYIRNAYYKVKELKEDE